MTQISRGVAAVVWAARGLLLAGWVATVVFVSPGAWAQTDSATKCAATAAASSESGEAADEISALLAERQPMGPEKRLLGIDISSFDAEDRKADDEVVNRYAYPDIRIDRFSFKGKSCRRAKVTESALHMVPDYCFRKAKTATGTKAKIVVELGSKSQPLSQSIKVPSLEAGEVRSTLEACIRDELRFTGKGFWGQTEKGDFTKTGEKTACTVRYSITQTLVESKHRPQWDKNYRARQVRAPKDYRLTTRHLFTNGTCDTKALKDALESRIDNMKECISMAGLGIFGRHHIPFHVLETGGLTTARRKYDRSPRQRPDTKEMRRQCKDAPDRKACRKEWMARARKGGPKESASARHHRQSGRYGRSSCVYAHLRGINIRKKSEGNEGDAGVKNPKVRPKRMHVKRRPAAPKTACSAMWIMEHTRKVGAQDASPCEKGAEP